MSNISLAYTGWRYAGGTGNPGIVEPPPSEDPGTNILVNSVLDGSPPSSWTVASGGTVTYPAGDNSDVYVRHSVTGTQRSALQQNFSLSAGEIATLSFKTIAVDDATDGGRSAAYTVGGNITLLSDKPTVADLVPGERAFWRIQANEASDIRFDIGPGVGDGAVDITLGEPMIDINDGLRAYDPTQPSAVTPPSELTALRFLPHYGWGVGNPGGWGEKNWNLRLRGLWNGFWIKAPYTGTVTALTFQMRSNRIPLGETTKSRVAGNNSHGAHTWNYQVEGYDSNAQADAVGSPAWTLTGSVFNGGDDNDYGGFIRRFTPAGGWSVVQDNFYFVRFFVTDANPTDNHFSLNGSACRAVTMGLSPPRQCNPSPALGDWPIIITGSGPTSMAPFSRSVVGSFGMVYSDGVEYGTNGHDATASTWRQSIYGSTQVRQTYRYPWWAIGDRLWIGAWRLIGQTPASSLSFTLVGPGVNLSFTRTPAQIPEWDPSNYTLPPARSFIDFAPQTFQANQDYVLTVSASGSTSGARYWWGATRQKQPERAYSDAEIDTQHLPGGVAERSTNGGSTWLPVGYASPPYGTLNSFLSFGQRVAETEAGLAEL